jgi:hypothetical protein
MLNDQSIYNIQKMKSPLLFFKLSAEFRLDLYPVVGVILSLNAKYLSSQATSELTNSAIAVDDPDEGGQRSSGVTRSLGNLELDGGVIERES